MNKKLLTGLGIIGGVVFLGIAIFYWTTPAGHLPTYVPGYEIGSATIHFKHGLAALILSIFSFIYTWFSSAKEVK
ncbi:hypothetical protein H0X32_00425 [Patescibacteria group bacterium]|nr:hypothetical protein [Patescibacteria group bacterium]